MKGSLLLKTMCLIILAVLLSAVLTALVFSFYGQRTFALQKVQELKPRAEYLADITAEYVEGYIGSVGFQRAVASEYHVWDAALYIFNSDKELMVMPANRENENERDVSLVIEYLDTVLTGEEVASRDTFFRDVGVVIGQPAISRYGNVVGAVFLVKPIREVRTALQGLTASLVISMLASVVLMLVPAYLGSRSLVRPLRQMNEVAHAMAHGDFSVRAHEKGNGEVAQLGKTLNYLSAELSRTINDLTFERNRLRAVLNGMKEGIVALDASQSVTLYNPAALRLLGCGTDGSITDALGKNDIFAWLAGGSVSLELPSGEAMLRLTRTELYEPDGQKEGDLLLLQDVTESERLEQTRREYVANVSHELRTPIASIRGLADALNDGLVEQEVDKARYYSYILHETLRLSRLIDDLLELSRLQSGKVELPKQAVDVKEMALDIVDRYASVAAEHGMTIRAVLQDTCKKAYTNPDKAEQVLVALVDNAIKHAGEGGEVTVTLNETPEALKLVVSNPGSIDERDINHIFERFYKADKSHSGGGTGLGLSIASEIMALMGERLSVKSAGGQVEFTMTLGTIKPECDKTIKNT